MEKLENIHFVNDCIAVLNEQESAELNKYIASATVESPILVSAKTAENKKGFTNTYNINVSYGVKSDAGEAYVEIGTSDKVRGIIPSLFGGITGKTNSLEIEDSKFDPFIILGLLGKFLGFLKIVIYGLEELWKKLDEWLKGSGANDGKDGMKTEAFKTKEDLEEKKDELNFANASVEAKIPTDLFPKSKANLLDIQAMVNNQKGMGLYKVFQNGRKEQVIDPNGVITNVLIVNSPTNTAIKIEQDVVGLLFVWLSSSRQTDGGNIWGRWHMYEQE